MPEPVSLEDVAGGTERRIGIQDSIGKPLEQMRLVGIDLEMTKLHLCLGPGERARTLESGRVTMVVGEIERLFSGRCDERRERHANGSAGCKMQVTPEAHDRIEYRAGCVRERATVDHRHRRANRAPAAEEARAVGLELNSTHRLTLASDDMGCPHLLLAGRPRAACRQQRTDVRDEFGLDEEIRESGVGSIGGRRGEDDFRVRGELDVARASAEVRERDSPHFRIILRGDDDFERGRDRAIPPDDLDALFGVLDLIGARLDTARLVTGRPDLAAVYIAYEDVRAEVIARHVLAPAGDGKLAPSTVAGSGRRHHHGVSAVGEKVRPRSRVVRRFEAANTRRNDVAHGHGRLDLFGPRTRDGDVAGRALLEKQLGRSHHRLVAEPRSHLAAAEHIVESDQQHALVVRHVGAHDRGTRSVRDAGWRVVEGFVEAVSAASAIGGNASEILRRFPGIDHRCEPGRIGGNHYIRAQAPLEPEARHTEARVLVRSLEVEGAVGGFGDTPRHAAFAPVAHLPADDEPVSLVEEASSRRVHDERRHQVFEHRAGPGNERRASVHGCERTAELKPVGDGHVALGDRDEAREACLGGEQIVAVRIELAVAQPVPDGEELACWIEEEAEIHLLEELASEVAEPRDTAHERDARSADALEVRDQRTYENDWLGRGVWRRDRHGS